MIMGQLADCLEKSGKKEEILPELLATTGGSACDMLLSKNEGGR